MPLYEYTCTSCGRKISHLVNMREGEPIIMCKDCGHQMERIFSSEVSFRGKGGGWMGLIKKKR